MGRFRRSGRRRATCVDPRCHVQRAGFSKTVGTGASSSVRVATAGDVHGCSIWWEIRSASPSPHAICRTAGLSCPAPAGTRMRQTGSAEVRPFEAPLAARLIAARSGAQREAPGFRSGAHLPGIGGNPLRADSRSPARGARERPRRVGAPTHGQCLRRACRDGSLGRT
jgi:hypothetical protein